MNLRLTALAVITSVAFLLYAFCSCGAGGQPVQPDPRYYEPSSFALIYTYLYYPYVEHVELIGDLLPGEVITVELTIHLPDEIPENLYYTDTLSEPIAKWEEEEGYTYLVTSLRQVDSESDLLNAGLREYDCSGQLIHRILVPSPGEYELRYWSAVSPELAGKYAIELSYSTGELELRSLYFEVPEAE